MVGYELFPERTGIRQAAIPVVNEDFLPAITTVNALLSLYLLTSQAARVELVRNPLPILTF
jgi:hypothetical protein